MNPVTRLALVIGGTALVASAAAQTTYPEKAIRLLIGYPPGSQTDVIARVFGQKLSEFLGKPVVTDNAAGAAGTIAADRTAKAVPDGYTLGYLAQGALVINPSLSKLGYEAVKDFSPVSQITVSSNVLVVHNAVAAKSVKELVALAKAQPGVLTYASGGSGSAPHLAGEFFKSMAGVDVRHIPYKGVVAAIPDLIGERVSMMFGATAVVMPLAREGKLRALAVTALRRSPALADLPTVAESGYPGFEVSSWNGLFAPARTPAPIVQRLHGETVKILAHADLRARLGDFGLESIGNSPDEFAAVIKFEVPKWAKVIKEAGINSE